MNHIYGPLIELFIRDEHGKNIKYILNYSLHDIIRNLTLKLVPFAQYAQFVLNWISPLSDLGLKRLV